VLRRRLLLLGVAALLGCASVCLWTSPANAAAPVKDGWWTETNQGIGFAPPAPPQVPSGGLYIENGFTGPTAISALTFQVNPGDSVGSIALKIAGNPVITSPPVACPITAAGQNYQPAQGGAWGDAPAYDCTKAQVTGKVSSDNTTVTFDAGPLLDNGTIAAVIKAGGNADQVAFNAPGPDTLTVTPGGGSGGDTSGAPSGSPAGETSGQPIGVGSGSGATGASPVAPVSGLSSLPAFGATATPPALAAGAPAGVTPSTQAGGGQIGPGSRSSSGPQRLAFRTSGSTSGSGSSVRKDVAEVIGVAAVLAALVAYSEGFGLLGGRIDRPARRQPPASLSSEA
jgi:hypothetical protein